MKLCPVCQMNFIKTPTAKQCRACYLKSDLFLEQLRNRAKRANQRANEVRWAYKHDHDWQFIGSSPELAYIVGAYLTDGWVQRMTNAEKKIAGFGISGAYFELIEHVKHCLITIGVPEIYQRIRDRSHEGRRKQLSIAANSQNLGNWLHEESAAKVHIPSFLLSIPLAHQLAFLAALIDGDGCVATDGTMALYGAKPYMKELPPLLASMNIHTPGYHPIKTLPSGKIFARVSVNRSDFLSAGGQLIVVEKQRRLLSPLRKPQKKAICPLCGGPMSYRSQTCQRCFLSSDSHHEHLKQIAPEGGRH